MPYGIDLLQGAGAQAAGGIVNEGLGIAFQGIKNKQQLKQARRLQDLGLEAEATRGQRNEAMAMRMFENTGYGAQVDQMKRAGINPALLYGMSAGGGTTQAQAAATGGTGQAQTAQGVRGTEGMGLMIGQMGLLQAQKENIEADTANKKASATNTGVQTDLNKLELQFNKDSYEDNLDIIRAQFSNLQEDANRKNRENVIGDKTQDASIWQRQQEAIEAYLKNLLIGAQISNTEQSTEESRQRIIQSESEIKRWATDIAQKWKELEIKEKEMLIHSFAEQVKAKYPGAWNVLGGMVNDVVNSINKTLGIGPPKLDKPKEK